MMEIVLSMCIGAIVSLAMHLIWLHRDLRRLGQKLNEVIEYLHHEDDPDDPEENEPAETNVVDLVKRRAA